MDKYLELGIAFSLIILSALIFILDQFLGIVAYSQYYLAFCAATASFAAAVWFVLCKKNSFVVLVIVFSVLACQFLITPPSERLLRSVMLEVAAGTEADNIETVVRKTYKDSGHVLPRITTDKDRIHVSLLSENSGNCTAVIFLIKNGVVINRTYSPD